MNASAKTTNLVIDVREETPLYQQVKRQALERIESGAWVPGKRLPTDDAIAKQLRVHYHTVRLALSALAKEGHLVRHRGRGTFVAEPRVKHHIGILFGTDIHHFEKSPFNTLFAKHAQDYFHQHEREVKMYLVQQWLDERHGACNEDFAREIKQRALKACVVACGAQFDAADTFDLLLRHRVPFVIGTHFPTDFPSFGFDLEDLVAAGMNHLAARGYRRIAIVYGRYPESPVSPQEEVFFQAYRRAITRLGLQWRREWIKDEREPGQEAGYHAMKELWVSDADRPDAVLSCDDVMTQGIIHAWWELGIQAPRDLGFITHSNKEVPLLYPVSLTRLECDIQELVNAAAQLLYALIESKPLAQRKVFVAASLVAGKSCGEQ